MTDPTDGRREERRRHPRIEPKGTVILHAGEHVQRGRITNVSEGGLLIGTSVAAPERLLGRQATVELRFDGQSAEWLPGSGKILRITADTVAIAFDELTGTMRRDVSSMAGQSRAHHRVMNVLLVDSDPKRRAAMLAGFRAAGCVVVEASTPLEAIVRLGESSFEPELIAIADSAPTGISTELREFVEREHPYVKLVTIGNELLDPKADPASVVNWLSSANPEADLRARVREMLGRPRRPTRP